jgi:pseudomonalisin
MNFPGQALIIEGMKPEANRIQRSIRGNAMGAMVLAMALWALPSSPAVALRPSEDVSLVFAGSVPPPARPERDRGPADPDSQMERMLLPLQRRAGADAEIESLLVRQQDPASADYHRWLTPEEFGNRFGLSDENIQEVVDWLSEQGFRLDSVARGRGWIRFSGTVRQVEEAFQTAIRRFEVNGELHQSNAFEISLPRRIARWAAGPVALHNFRSRPLHHILPAPSEEPGNGPRPLYNSGSGNHYLAPADFARIYNSTPLTTGGVDGSAVKIAVVGRTNVHLGDVQLFRSFFGLPAKDPVIVLNGKDPGVVSADEESEAELDLEWSGAVAPGAEIDLVVTADTDTTDGVTDSSTYAVDNNLAPIVTLSFGLCEMFSETFVFNSLWTQAAAQGISVFVASGDDGAAGCEDADATVAKNGPWVNGLCSSPSDVCVGGTQFLDTDSPSTYWGISNDSTTKASALGYIPEMSWNESGGPCGALCASGGGASTLYARPSWQVAPGVPSDITHRYVPDVSINGATHVGYLTYINNSMSLSAFGGTSASSPAFAGIMALVVQRFGRQGNPNPRLYQLAAAQLSTGAPAVFHDIAQGNTDVPGQTGFLAGVGYDQATGLGSVDVNALVANWSAVPPVNAQKSVPVKTGTPRRPPRTVGFH